MMKRHSVYPIHFDTRSSSLEDEQIHWDEHIKLVHRENKEKIIKGIKNEFGGRDIEIKVQNFHDLGQLPFSIVSYHNRYFQQAREAFALGAYYPAATEMRHMGLMNSVALYALSLCGGARR